MTDRKPRAFHAMREDRVRDMAARTFGRSFGSKRDAVEALSALPVDRQHALKKRADPSAPARSHASASKFYDTTRGGIARAPSAEKLAAAVGDRPQTLMRLARASTGMKVSSPAQALTLLRKFGSTDMSRSADKAYGLVAKDAGGRWQGGGPMATKARPAVATTSPGGPRKSELLQTYQRMTGVAASPRATKSWLSGEIAAARSRQNANRISAAVQLAALTTSAVGTYRRARAEQAGDPTKRSVAGDYADRGKAAFDAAISVAPGAALTAVQGTANVAAALTHALPLGLQWHSPVTKAAMAVAQVSGRAVLPALAAWSMHRGAIEDTSALRGAGRGLVRAIDPSAMFMGRGLAERAYDRAFGTSPPLPVPGFWDNPRDPKFSRQPNAYERFGIDALKRVEQALPTLPGSRRNRTTLPQPGEMPWPFGRGSEMQAPRAFIDARARDRSVADVAAPSNGRPAARPATPTYKDTWDDSRGRTYHRRDLSVRTG